MSRSRPIQVAVIGGGCASIAAAFELSRPEHEGKYRVTVYQQGWRLGGKGASGRGVADRIEEHGLHVWMGWYENAFRLMRECYAELDRDPETFRIAGWRDAFVPAPVVGVMDRAGLQQWRQWTASLPPMNGLPGDPLSEDNPFSVTGYLCRVTRLLRTLFESVGRSQPDVRQAAAAPDREGWQSRLSPEAIRETVARLAGYGQLVTIAGVIEVVAGLEMVFETWLRFPQKQGAEKHGVLRLIEAVSRGGRQVLEGLIRRDAELRRLWEVIDYLLAVVRGSLRFGLATDPRGFDAIDDYDFREWLAQNGAAGSTLDSALVLGLYDLYFAYEDGDVERPRFSAAQALRSSLRMFCTYRGEFFWKMQAGMGDVVFAPYYQVLKSRGVRFEFFHRLENVRLADPEDQAPGERAYVEALEFDVQARIEGGGEYRPLIDVRGLPSWPASPDFRQLVDGERLEREEWQFESFWDRRSVAQRRLRATEDFDFVVLGVGLGAVPHLCREIVERDPRWRRMVENVKTVGTQAFQIWLQADGEELGWPSPPVTLSAFVRPFATWADMRHLLAEESWPRDNAPRALAYFCDVLPTPDETPDRGAEGYPADQREAVRRAAIRFLGHDAGQLWHGAVHGPGEFRWELLIGSEEPPAARSGEAHFDDQFWIANVNPTDRYSQSLPGTAKYRISPLDDTYENLTVAGDWTSCGFNAGCVEAAVISGRLAAHALSRSPALEDIIGFDHP